MLKELVFPIDQKEISEGWKTREQWDKDEGTSRSATQELLRKGMEMGIIEKKNFYVMGKDNICRQKPHYRIKDQKKK